MIRFFVKSIWELFDFLEGNESIEAYSLSGKAKWLNEADGELHVKDVRFEKDWGEAQTVCYDNREVTIKEARIDSIYEKLSQEENSEYKTLCEKNMQVLYAWWIGGNLFQNVVKGAMIGIVELRKED